jgi:hypothetical protein
MRKIAPTREAAFLCGALPETRILYLSFSELELAPELPGWYCWIYCPEDLRALQSGFAKHASVMARVDAVLGASYCGELTLEQTPCDVGGIEKHLGVLQSTMLAFAPPLYIGISKSLRGRLRQHSRQLLDSLHGGRSWKTDDRISSDTDEESSYFANRVAKVMADMGIGEGSLYVKCLVGDTVSQLRPVEAILNRAYSPPFGRK